MYIYSSNKEMETFKLTIHDIESQKRAFSKGEGVEPLIRKIMTDMSCLYNFYVGHEECQNLFNEGFLKSKIKPIMDELVKRYSDSSLTYDPYNRMRKILENMLQNLTDIGIIKVDVNAKDSLNIRIKYLCESCPIKRNKEGKEVPDFDNPFVPFSTCNQETKYLIKFLGDMTNHNSHFVTKHSDSYLGYYYDRNVLQATYSAFFAVMKWYYTFMHDRSMGNV